MMMTYLIGWLIGWSLYMILGVALYDDTDLNCTSGKLAVFMVGFVSLFVWPFLISLDVFLYIGKKIKRKVDAK
jgi:hypothetical protein